MTCAAPRLRSISLVEDQNRPVRLRALFLGDRNTGKSSYALRACSGDFSPQKMLPPPPDSPISEYCLDRVVVPEGRQLLLEISDPDGSWLRTKDGLESCRELVEQANIIMFFMSDRDADEHERLEKYVDYANRHASPDCLYGFVLNLRLRRMTEFYSNQLERIVMRERGFGYVVSISQDENVLESIFDIACASYYASRLLSRRLVALQAKQELKESSETSTSGSLSIEEDAAAASDDDSQLKRRWWSFWC